MKNMKLVSEMRSLLGESTGPAAEAKDADELKNAKKCYMALPDAMHVIREMMDALSNLSDKRAGEANDELSKALKLVDHAAETMRLMGLQKA